MVMIVSRSPLREKPNSRHGRVLSGCHAPYTEAGLCLKCSRPRCLIKSTGDGADNTQGGLANGSRRTGSQGRDGD